MDRELIRDVFDETGFSYKIESIKNDNNRVDMDISCDIVTLDDIEKFISCYMNLSNETLKIKTKRKCSEKSSYSQWISYRCHHDTRYEKTRNSKEILTKKPMKRFRNTYCPFQMTVKVLKITSDKDLLKCKINLEYIHNHPIESLHALSFKSISTETSHKINLLYESGLTPSQAYSEFIQNFRISCDGDLDFHLKKADRSNCPRRIDFNALYKKFCEDHFGGRNGPEMFSLLEEKIHELKEKEGLKIDFKLYDKDSASALIIAIVTPFMCRVHSMVMFFFPFSFYIYLKVYLSQKRIVNQMMHYFLQRLCSGFFTSTVFVLNLLN